VRAGIIDAEGIAATGKIGKAAKAKAAQPISIKRFIGATPWNARNTARSEENVWRVYKVPMLEADCLVWLQPTQSLTSLSSCGMSGQPLRTTALKGEVEDHR
jgi:hypothetical protein